MGPARRRTKSDACTSSATCVGTAYGCPGTPKDCSALNAECKVGVCDATDGTCKANNKANGTTCTSTDRCLIDTVCLGGQCQGTPKDCSAMDGLCAAGKCDPADGVCKPEKKPVGTSCAIANQCEENGQCDAAGACVGSPLRDGTPCNDNGCTTGACRSGKCDCSAPWAGRSPEAPTWATAGRARAAARRLRARGRPALRSCSWSRPSRSSSSSAVAPRKPWFVSPRKKSARRPPSWTRGPSRLTGISRSRGRWRARCARRDRSRRRGRRARGRRARPRWRRAPARARAGRSPSAGGGARRRRGAAR